ncbi:T9SS type A sorting domain-containing protein [Phaeocystidibacter luteus]|uniref:T9SS type A sorting domain-containing protein n=1 Tax=Phaeocystidibacter luteus TaxID=911197 RepID=A0A6N6RKJ7_9FLAO|nr:T9SS type A sorting domain-containing protein [Phaeocystidibacter luteus]KAB2807353.1 T9SS type A sorting domain-containing protein [Phaeocystidibacter luteus]
MKKYYILILMLSFGLAHAQLNQIDLPIDWEGSTTDYTVTDFGGALSTVQADPNNMSNTVLKTDKPNTAQTWAGTTLSTSNGLATAIPFASSTVILVDVWSADSGVTVRLKAEDHTNNTITVETDAMTTVAGGWQTLAFDFSNQAPGTAALNTSNTYDMLSIFYNFNTVPAATQTYYADSVRMGAGSSLAQIALPINWEGTTTNYTVSDFGGNASQVVVDPTNASNMVLESQKTAGAQTWAGTTLGAGSGLASPIPFAAGNTTMTVRVWSPDAGIEVRLKAEDVTDPTKSVETVDTTTVANGWQIMTFDFANQAAGTAPINFATTYNKLSIFYNFGVDGATAGLKTYYCDDVMMSSANPPGTYNVTFRVDMSTYTGSYTTPEVNGEFNNWCGNCAPLADPDGDDIWELTVPIMADSIEYKFSYDNWAGQESLSPGSPCTKTNGNFTNRFMYVTADTVLEAVCWESCATCTGAPVSANVTFQVDLSNYSGSYTEVNINGTFNNWCGNCAVMTDANMDSIYEITINVPTDTIEYKFTLDGWTVDETLTSGDPCTITVIDGGNTFVNRYFVPSADTTLPVVCWEECSDCESIGIDESDWANLISITPNPSNGLIFVDANFDSYNDIDIQVVNIQGQTVYESSKSSNALKEVVDLTEAPNGIYFVRISNGQFTHAERVLIAH